LGAVEHFVAAPGVDGGVGAGAAGVATAGGEFHDDSGLAVDVGDAEGSGRAEGGVGLDGNIVVLQVPATGRNEVALEVPLAGDKDERVEDGKRGRRGAGGGTGRIADDDGVGSGVRGLNTRKG